jgi:putative flippase GtrA
VSELSSGVRLPPRVRHLLDRHGRKMAKYVLASAGATVASVLTFMATFGSGLLGSRVASLTASAAGAVVNYVVNRRWTWGRRGRAGFRSELLPYWGTVVAIAVIAAVVVGIVNAVVRDVTDARSIRTLANTGAYVTVYATAFLVKYRAFDRLFTRRTREEQRAAEASDPPVHAEQEAVS